MTKALITTLGIVDTEALEPCHRKVHVSADLDMASVFISNPLYQRCIDEMSMILRQTMTETDLDDDISSTP